MREIQKQIAVLSAQCGFKNKQETAEFLKMSPQSLSMIINAESKGADIIKRLETFRDQS